MLKDPSIQLGLKGDVKGEMRAEMKASKRSRSHLISFKLVEGGGGWGWWWWCGRGRWGGGETHSGSLTESGESDSRGFFTQSRAERDGARVRRKDEAERRRER